MGQSDLYSDLSSDLSSDLRFCYLPMFAQNIHKALHIPVDLMKTWVLGGVPYIYIYNNVHMSYNSAPTEL